MQEILRKLAGVWKFIASNIKGLTRGDTFDTIPSQDYPIYREQSPASDLFFKSLDEVLRIDYVLVYDPSSKGKDGIIEKLRANYHKNLIKAGLKLTEDQSGNDVLKVVKVHCPLDKLFECAEELNIKKPMKPLEKSFPKVKIEARGDWLRRIRTHWYKLFLPYTRNFYKEDRDLFTTPFRVDRKEMFQATNWDEFFQVAERIRIVNHVMCKTRWKVDKVKGMGYLHLIFKGAYLAAYPLHEGSYKRRMTKEAIDHQNNDRSVLFENWVGMNKFFAKQPLNLIRNYYGEKISFFFGWLEHFTYSLCVPSAAGVVALIYAAATVSTHEPTNEICDMTGIGRETICPQCDQVCTYEKLHYSCLNSKVAYLIDNDITIPFSIFILVWGHVVLRMWKRRERELCYDWDVENYREIEVRRPQYEKMATIKAVNPSTGRKVTEIQRAEYVERTFLSGLMSICLFTALIGSGFFVIFYRLHMLHYYLEVGTNYRQYAKLSTSMSGAFVNLIYIVAFDKMYRIFAYLLTGYELPRTLIDFEKLFSYKLYFFKFINNYSSIFYMAFFKGSFRDSPAEYDYALKSRPEDCDPSGCFIELTIQILMIFGLRELVGVIKQLFEARVYRMFIRYKFLMNLLSFRQLKRNSEDVENRMQRSKETLPQWQLDYYLMNFTSVCLVDEYMSTAIQFGFVMLFISTMPLIPLFAVIHNVFRIRISAYKFITKFRRPCPERARGIGYWYKVLRSLAVMGVLTNAFLIAFASDVITRYYYRISRHTNSLEGYVDFTLSIFNTSHFKHRGLPRSIPLVFGNFVDTCRYRDFREMPTVGGNEYYYTTDFWNLITTRVLFILIYEHLVFILVHFIEIVLPARPAELRIREDRERYMEHKLIFPTLESESEEEEKEDKNKDKKKKKKEKTKKDEKRKKEGTNDKMNLKEINSEEDYIGNMNITGSKVKGADISLESITTALDNAITQESDE